METGEDIRGHCNVLVDGPQPTRSRASGKERRESSVERSLATICEAHQKVLAVVAALEKEIERLSCTWTWLEVRARSKSRDHQGCERVECKRRHHQVSFEDHLAPYCPSCLRMGSIEEAATAEDSDLEEPAELGPEVESFLRGSMGTSEDKDKKMPLEPPVTEFNQWALWKADRYKTPSCWVELSAVLEVGTTKGWPGRCRPCLDFPGRLRELSMKEASSQAPPAPPCLCQQKFMPSANSIFASRDIREIPQEKAVAYARDLQHWAEKTDLPAGGKPCLLVESMKELREETKCYLSFSDEEVFKGVALPEEVSKEEVCQGPETMSTDVLKRGGSAESPKELAIERRGPKFLGWKKILHPSQPVVATGEISHPLRALRLRGEPIQITQTEPSKPSATLQETPIPSRPSLPVWELAVI